MVFIFSMWYLSIIPSNIWKQLCSSSTNSCGSIRSATRVKSTKSIKSLVTLSNKRGLLWPFYLSSSAISCGKIFNRTLSDFCFSDFNCSCWRWISFFWATTSVVLRITSSSRNVFWNYRSWSDDLVPKIWKNAVLSPYVWRIWKRNRFLFGISNSRPLKTASPTGS